MYYDFSHVITRVWTALRLLTPRDNALLVYNTPWRFADSLGDATSLTPGGERRRKKVGGREIECTEALPLVFQNRMGNAATVVLIQSSRFGALNTALESMKGTTQSNTYPSGSHPLSKGVFRITTITATRISTIYVHPL